MRRAKMIAVTLIIALASSVVAYEAFDVYQSSNSALAKCERGAANGASGITASVYGVEMGVSPGSDTGNLTLSILNDACGFVSGVVVMTMRPTLNGTEDLSVPSLVTNASFVEYNGSSVSPSNTIPLDGGIGSGSLSVQNVSPNQSYTMEIAILFTNANPDQHQLVWTTTFTST